MRKKIERKRKTSEGRLMLFVSYCKHFLPLHCFSYSCNESLRCLVLTQPFCIFVDIASILLHPPHPPQYRTSDKLNDKVSQQTQIERFFFFSSFSGDPKQVSDAAFLTPTKSLNIKSENEILIPEDFFHRFLFMFVHI